MLTNAAAKAAGAQSRAYKLHDTGGLHLFVAPTGLKSWRLKYRWRGREKLLTIGRFDQLNLAQARMRREEAKEQLRGGVDPALRQAQDERETFEQLARAWYRHNLTSWSASHAADVIGSLERTIFPELGSQPIAAIAAPELLRALREIEKRGTVITAQRVRQRLCEIFDYAIAEGLAEKNAASSLAAAMREAPPATPHPALISIPDCRALLQACETAAARPITRLASRFLALTAVRLDCVRGMRWCELEDLDGDRPLWRVPPARMKLKKAKKGEARFEHVVPLSAAAVAVLREAARENGYDTRSNGVNPRSTWGEPQDLVFPGRGGSASIGEGAIGELYDRAGYAGRHVPHGWRSSFSTILNEQLGEEWSVTIDRALAHTLKDKTEAAYNRAQLLERRRQIFDRWGELLAPGTLNHVFGISA